mgnify:CR=1 FL=1
MFLRIVYALIMLLLAVPQAVGQQQQWEEGTHYRELASEVQTRSGARSEVVEVFWYGCPHCYDMQPLINQWKKGAGDDVNLRHVPASMRPSWEPHAKAFYVARELGILDTVHPRMFEALAGGDRKLNSKEAVAAFFEEIGAADAEAVREAWGSFAVDTAMRRGRSLQKGARVRGTPTLVVAGRYVISTRKAGSYENMLAIADYLVEKEGASGE